MSSYIPTATVKFMYRDYPCQNRVPHRTLREPEPCEAKVSSTVLWGGNGGNAASLTRPILSFERNVVSPYRSSQEESRPQGKPTAARVKEEGESESWAVIVRIRGETVLDAKAGRLPSGHSS